MTPARSWTAGGVEASAISLVLSNIVYRKDLGTQSSVNDGAKHSICGVGCRFLERFSPALTSLLTYRKVVCWNVDDNVSTTNGGVRRGGLERKAGSDGAKKPARDRQGAVEPSRDGASWTVHSGWLVGHQARPEFPLGLGRQSTSPSAMPFIQELPRIPIQRSVPRRPIDRWPSRNPQEPAGSCPGRWHHSDRRRDASRPAVAIYGQQDGASAAPSRQRNSMNSF